MRLIYDNAPQVGENFRLSIYTSVGPARVEWYIGGLLIQRTECADPPCHEQMYMRPEYKDNELYIIGTDRAETRELRLRIMDRDTDNDASPSGAAMA